MKRKRVTLSPPRVTRGSSGTETDEQRERVLRLNRALDFMVNVRRTLDREKYLEFIAIFRQHDSIGMGGIADRMKVLFRGHPDLKHRLNMFLPRQYQLSLTEDDEQEEVPATNSLQGRPTQCD